MCISSLCAETRCQCIRCGDTVKAESCATAQLPDDGPATEHSGKPALSASVPSKGRLSYPEEEEPWGGFTVLNFGRHVGRTCSGLSRRSFLEIGASSVLGLTWTDWLRARQRSPGATRPRARAVILLWLWGGPSQLDTWDPKPLAPLEIRGPLAPIATRVPGVRITELFPRIADLAGDFAILRSLHTHSNDHGVAGTAGLTGSSRGAVNLGGASSGGSARPALGSTVARALGAANRLPAFMVVGGKLHQGKKPIVGEGGGPLGAAWDPLRLEYDPRSGTKIPALQLLQGLTVERLADRRELLSSFSQVQRALDTEDSRTLDPYREQAFAMLTAPAALSLFDLSREKPALRDAYGRTRFGQSCLLARRLVEGGVPFVQVNWSDHVEAEEDSGDGGWDHHYRNFQIMQDRHAPWLDQAFSRLLVDLKQRGLLDSTLVLAVGEFGRTPKINDKAGRDHWEHVYSALVAGGGVRGGQVYGESDARAERPTSHPLTPADLVATVQHAVGLSSEQAQQFNLAVEGRVIEALF